MRWVFHLLASSDQRLDPIHQLLELWFHLHRIEWV
jgi:hypothetical protein